MTNSSSWWANKLNQQQPQRGGVVLPPVQTSQPQPVRHAPQVQEQSRPLNTGERQDVLDPNRAPNDEVSMGEAMRLWRGGEAHRKEGHLECPECGSTTGYTAYSSAGSARINGQQPRPHCFECGYNGSFSQGLQSNWS